MKCPGCKVDMTLESRNEGGAFKEGVQERRGFEYYRCPGCKDRYQFIEDEAKLVKLRP